MSFSMSLTNLNNLELQGSYFAINHSFLSCHLLGYQKCQKIGVVCDWRERQNWVKGYFTTGKMSF